MWLTTPNGEHFITSLWVVSEGVWFRKWTTAQKEKVCSHEAVDIESANYLCPAPECQADRMLQLPKSSDPLGVHAPQYSHQTLTGRQEDRHKTWVSKVLLTKREGPCHMVEWGCDIEPCVRSLPSLSHISFPSANSNTNGKWRVRGKQSVSVCESVCVSFSTMGLSELYSVSGTMQPL